MRPFDSKNSWLDSDGNPLVGRLKFCKLHTTELENVYDYQGTVLDNPIFTNTIGQIVNQVFLADKKDYTIIFEKYIGNGDMTIDQDNWLFQYSCDNLWDVYGIQVDSTTFQLVNNIDDLRALSPAEVTDRGYRVVILGGYNIIGDKPQVMYYWDEYSIENDNGGSVIKVNDIETGRWSLVNAFGFEGVDVRHFGVFGTDSRTEATDTMSLQIGLANDYANSIGLPLYFPSINGLTWYKMNNLNLAKAIFANETRVFGNTGTSSVITIYDDNNYLDVFTNSDYNAVFTIRGKIVRTSWGINSNNCIFDPEYKLIVDSIVNTVNKTFNNIVIDFQYEIFENGTFTNCQLNSIEKLGDGNTFHECKLTERMFSDSTDYNTIEIFDDDEISIDDFQNVSNWLTLRTQLADTVLDLRGRILDSTCDVGWGTATYKNAVFSNYTVKQQNAYIENCSGIFADNNIIENLYITNSNVTTDSQSLDQLYLTNSKFTISNPVNNVTVDDLQMANSSLNNAAITYNCQTVVAYDSIISPIIYAKEINIQKCDIYNTIYQSTVTAQLTFVMCDNTFFSGDGHVISSEGYMTTVNGKWDNNISYLNKHFITIDRTHFDPDDTHHNYSYLNNTGSNVLQNKYNIFLNLQLSNYNDWNDPATLSVSNYPNEDTVVFGFRSDGNMLAGPAGTYKFFTVGTSNFYVNVDWNLIGWNDSQNSQIIPNQIVHNYLSQTVSNGFVLRAIHANDYDWRLVIPYVGQQWANNPLNPGETIITNTSIIWPIGSFTWDSLYPGTGSILCGSFSITKI